MNIPNFNCQINVFCAINPSEDPKKVKQAILNLFPQIEIQFNNNSLKATSQNLESLSRIFDVIHSRKAQNVYRRFMNNNLHHNSTWFYLNKQAAFSNTVSLCEKAEESPLGPIKIVLISNKIEQIIEWLISK